MNKFFQRLLFVILIMLPIIDQVNRFNEDSPAVMIRAGVTIIMFLMLALQVFHHGLKQGAMANNIMFLIIYMAVVSVIIDGGFASLYSFVKVIYPLLGFLLIYYLARYNALDVKSFSCLIFALIVVYGVMSFLNLGQRLDDRGLSVADNTGYSLVMLLGGVLLFTRKKLLFILGIFIIVVGALLSGKRGALLALVVAAIPLAKFILTSYSRSSVSKLFFIVFSIAGGLLALYLFGDYFDATTARFESLEEDGGSGRDILYLLYLSHFVDSDFVHQIFGHGMYAGMFGPGKRFAFVSFIAHNDWLEMLFDFGVVGCFLFVLLFINIFRQIRKNKATKDAYYYMLIIVSVIFGIKSALSSTFFMSPNSIYLFMLLAFAVAKLESRSIMTLSR